MQNVRFDEIALLRGSGLLDAQWLARSLGIEGGAGVPLEFLYLDGRQYWGASTSPLFDGRHYLDHGADLVAAGVNPLLHYVTHGFFEGRSPSPVIDVDHVLEQIEPGAAAWDRQRKAECLRRYGGLRELLTATDADPCAFFENAIYRASLREHGIDAGDVPLEHYLRCRGKVNGAYLECASLASMPYYMSANADLAAADVVPLSHLVHYGLAEGRRFSSSPRVSATFLANSAHLSGNEALRGLKGFMLDTRGSGRLAGPAWPTPYAKRRLPALAHSAAPARRRAFVGVVLYRNSDEELRRLEASIRNEVKSNPDYRVEWAYFANDAENLPRYRALLGDRVEAADDGANLGFGRAHNHLMRACFAEDRLYVGANPDGYFTPGCLRALMDFSDYHGDHALVEAMAAPIDHPKWHDPVTLDTPWVSGACFALPRRLWNEVGGFDERIHLYCEDVDLSWRVRLIGGLLKICPSARFVHDVTPRFDAAVDEERERARRCSMLAGGYYLARKWGDREQAQRLREEYAGLVGRERLDALPEPEVEIDPAVARKVADFSLARFAPSRFWN
ncbi:Glycosyltransferase, GT2 family [Lysobacter sp. yr284]|uniref:hypothetical protein n=1 Tax=Lysobacter TaxID=68 RepID=UPI0008952C92|nr:hypothetical protein [Lysobacter sp. yr284]SDZ05049.1 Glycosyltransferase, GT2 family [Lysobacter sp. yr284]